MKKIIFCISLSIIISGIIFSSCKKTNSDGIDSEDLTVIGDNASGQYIFDDVLKIAEEAMARPAVSGGNMRLAAGGLLDCSIISVEDTSNINTTKTRVINIDFNANGNNCINFDGKIRAGKIIVSISNPSATSSSQVKYNAANAVTTINFDNYMVDTNTVTGKEIMTCSAPGTHSLVISNADGTGYATITYHFDGKTVEWKGNRTRKLTSGSGDTTVLNNSFTLAGTSEGYTRNGRHFVTTIDSTLRINLNCIDSNGTGRYPTFGTMSIVPDGKAVRILDYGPSNLCDNIGITYVSGTTPVYVGFNY